VVAQKVKILIALLATMVLLLGVSVAYATGSGGAPLGQATGSDIEKAKSVALDHVDGRVTGSTEVGDEEGAYEVEVIREDGSQVDVHLGRDFNVLSTPADHESPDGKDAPNDGGG
jgi:hypothetical protein